MNSDNQTKRRWSGRSIIILISVVVIGIIVLAVMVALPSLNRIVSEAGSSKDCQWTGTAVAWIDDDADAERDANENPLANVQFFVDDLNNTPRQVTSGVSDSSGSAKLSIFIAGCPETKIEVYPKVPDNYCLTTSARIAEDERKTYAFGFKAC